MTIYKYTLDITDTQTVILPKGAKILTVQMQHGNPQLWALVYPNPNCPTEPRIIETFGTGNPVPLGERKYINTYQLSGGALVFHVFERLS